MDKEYLMTTVQITLPDQLAEEARRAGLLTEEAIEGPVMTPEEILEEIKAARAERRAREGRAAGA